jgi:hypothetical protein
VTGARRELVAVRDHDVDPPRGASLELRASGLWAELTCETPLDHWSGGLEAFGVAMDDPSEAYGDERGQPVAVGFDLEWEASSPCRPLPGDRAYVQPCAVHGEVLLGRERMDLTADGVWTHEWGPRDWWDEPRWRAHGRLDDGTTFWASDAGPAGARPARSERETRAHLETEGGRPGLPSRGTLTVEDLSLDLSVVGHAPVLVPGPGGRTSRLWRAVVRFVAADGRRGAGWCEQLTPGG